MPLHGGICEFDPEHTPLPQDLDDPELADWFPSWLHNYRRRNMWPFAVYGPLPPIVPEDLRSSALGSAVSHSFARLPAMEQRHPGAAIWEGRPLCPVCEMPLLRDWCSLDPSHDVSSPVSRDSTRSLPLNAAENMPPTLPARSVPPLGPALVEDVSHLPTRPRPGRPLGASSQGILPELHASAAPLPTSIEAWLREMDDLGFLAVYHDAIAGHFDSAAQVVDVYANVRVDPRESAGEAFDCGGGDSVVGIAVPKFLDDMGVKKLGHRRLFEKWFAERYSSTWAAED